jgi:hypothetical protein
MLGIFTLFGRSREVQRLDVALRAAGLHPGLMPDAVKITLLKLLKEELGGDAASPEICAYAAELLAYCMLGAAHFTEANDSRRTGVTEARVEAALEADESLDARLVLLALHAGVVAPRVIERYDLQVT